MPAEPARLLANERIFRRLERAAARAADRGRWRSSLVWAHTAATFAVQCHPGVFCDVGLERTLARIGHAVVDPVHPVRDRSSPTWPDSVLHVLTQAYAVGGHTRWVARWIERDAGRAHSVALTGQGGIPVPRELEDAVVQSGGHVVNLGPATAGFVERAQALAQLAAGHDVVIDSTHPADVVAPVVFSVRDGGPPTVRTDHADERFWLGAGSSDVVVESRDVGRRWAHDRRGIGASRQVTFPLPVDRADVLPRHESRQLLGLDENDFAVLTVGSAHKFESVGGLDFFDVVLPAVRQLPRLTVIAVGPRPSGEWEKAAMASGMKIRAFAPRPDLRAFLGAADAFLNPYPIGSDTALLEAASCGLPAVSIRPPTAEMSLIHGDYSSLGRGVVSPEPEMLGEALAVLEADTELRRSVGAAAAHGVSAHHAGPGWQRRLSTIYDAAKELPMASLDDVGPCPALASEVDVALCHVANRRPGATLVATAAAMARGWARRQAASTPDGRRLARFSVRSRRRSTMNGAQRSSE